MHKLFHFVVVFFLLAPTLSVQAKQLIPMGETVQVELEMPNFIVTHDIQLASGEWLKRGDEVLSFNGQTMTQLTQIPQVDTELQIIRQNKELLIQMSKLEMEDLHRALKNATTGIGTLTYIDPKTKQFGALGHQIIDQVLDAPPAVFQGTLYLATINKIKKSEPGIPGYKIANDRQQLAVGEISSNDVYGIFGKWQQPLQQSLPPAVEIIHADEMELGPAVLQTSIVDQKVQQFEIEITEINGSLFYFTVNDADLITQTGGIVQGMSGSPILQKNRLVGAITHMFIEQPVNGAAISIVEMIKKSPD